MTVLLLVALVLAVLLGMALDVASTAYALQAGTAALSGATRELARTVAVRELYLGG